MALPPSIIRRSCLTQFNVFSSNMRRCAARSCTLKKRGEQCSRTRLIHGVRALLGEMMAAAALLTATLNFGGTLIMQIQGTGPLSLVVVECTSRHRMRATAKWSAVPESGTLAELVGSGRFGITLDPGAGRLSYQTSLRSRAKLSLPPSSNNAAFRADRYAPLAERDERRAAGLLLQKLHEREGNDADACGGVRSPSRQR